MYFRYISLKSKFSIFLFNIIVIFIHFYNVFALDSLKISSVLNSRLPGPRSLARSHIVLEYNNENMPFIRLLLRPAQTGQYVGQHVVQQIRPTCWSGFLWQLFCLTNMCKCLFICYKKKHSKFYDFDIWIEKKHSNSNSMLANMLACTANRTNMLFLQMCWPTFLNLLRNVGQHFSLIFSFANMFVRKANRTMSVSWCWSKSNFSYFSL